LIDKSFLVLFFKKELLSSYCLPFLVKRPQRGLVLERDRRQSPLNLNRSRSALTGNGTSGGGCEIMLTLRTKQPLRIQNS
jgi:hypothetical protein